MKRRAFLAGIIAAASAPAIPVPAFTRPKEFTFVVEIFDESGSLMATVSKPL